MLLNIYFWLRLTGLAKIDCSCCTVYGMSAGSSLNRIKKVKGEQSNCLFFLYSLSPGFCSETGSTIYTSRHSLSSGSSESCKCWSFFCWRNPEIQRTREDALFEAEKWLEVLQYPISSSWFILRQKLVVWIPNQRPLRWFQHESNEFPFRTEASFHTCFIRRATCCSFLEGSLFLNDSPSDQLASIWEKRFICFSKTFEHHHLIVCHNGLTGYSSEA